MEEETYALIAIVLAVIAIVGCLVVYTQIPEAEANPITWTAITQYNDKITSIQTRLTTLEQKQTTTNYDSVLINLRDDIDDLEDDFRDIDFSNSEIENLKDIEDCFSESNNHTEFHNCLFD